MHVMDANNMLSMGMVLIVAGILLIFLSTLKMASEARAKTEVAVVGFIGPVPVGFGTGKNALIMALLLGIVTLLLFVLWVKRIG